MGCVRTTWGGWLCRAPLNSSPPDMSKPLVVGVIPARYRSIRFPGKPLADLHGQPIVYYVHEQVAKAA